MASITSTASSKKHYPLLDGLRGVAAVLVIWYHFSEGFATSRTSMWINHGYLAVDFFFVLSGFVIGYAYDSRWKQGMTTGGFIIRRIIRLHPMVVLSVLLGGAAYLLQGSVKWDGTPVPLSTLVPALLLGLLVIPMFSDAYTDVRGNGEMFPINAPSWSLFFEYIGSILYAAILHRLPSKTLVWITALSAIGLAACDLGNMSGAYQLDLGWSMANGGFAGGFLRLSFSFCAGLLMSRGFRPRRIRGAFWICSALVTGAMCMPYMGPDISAYNCIYDLSCTFILFPAVVYIGACGTTTDRISTSLCGFLGKLSYPLYMVHYPIMYIFYAWIWENGLLFGEVWPVCIAIFTGDLILAWIAMKFYDEPVRRRLTAWCQRLNLSQK